NLAWGLIDAVMYLMSCVSERGHNLVILKTVRRATNEPETANRIIADALPPVVASVLPPPALDAVRLRLHQLPEPPARAQLTRDDWRGAAGVFLLVFLSTFPIVLPFAVLSDIRLAAHLSDVIAVT